MAKSHNQKAKILILEHLLAGTSRDQIVTMQEILDRLAEYDITAERKSIYDDLEALREFGLDIEFKSCLLSTSKDRKCLRYLWRNTGTS